MDEIQIPTQANFALKKGRNTSDRLVPDIMKALMEAINKTTIEYEGTKQLKTLGTEIKQNDDGDWYLTFDVIEPGEGFDHIEFTIKKTGWGMCLV